MWWRCREQPPRRVAFSGVNYEPAVALPLAPVVASESLGDWLTDEPLRIALIVIGAVVLSRLAQRSVRRGLEHVRAGSITRRLELSSDRVPRLLREDEPDGERTGQRLEAISSVLQSAIALFVYLIAVMLILAEVGISLAPLIAGAGVVGLAIGFGAQSLVKDFFSGLFILIEDQFGVGDIVDLGEATGTVESVSLRTTRLRSVDGVVWHVPNGEISRVGNMSQHWSRALLDIEVSYETDVGEAKRVIAEAARALAETDDDILDEPEVWGVEALAESSVVIRLVVKTRPSAQWRISRELRERIKAAFDREGIDIPFPQQTVWTRSPEDGAKAAPAD